jgi:hypothetical protein
LDVIDSAEIRPTPKLGPGRVILGGEKEKATDPIEDGS